MNQEPVCISLLLFLIAALSPSSGEEKKKIKYEKFSVVGSIGEKL